MSKLTPFTYDIIEIRDLLMSDLDLKVYPDLV